MSNQYSLMIYFIVATIFIYEKDIVIVEGETAGQFEDRNKAVLDRVFQEELNIFKYELSHRQMGQGILAYLNAKIQPQSVKETEAYQPL